MGKLFITDQALCICKFGAAPGKLKVSRQNTVFINANKKIATSLELGDCFYPPGFTVCNFSYPSRPCKAIVTQWSGLFEKLRIAGGGYPLLPDSKAVCTISGSPCIEITFEGQVEMPGAPQAKNATSEHGNDLNPAGDSSSVNEMSEDILIIS